MYFHCAGLGRGQERLFMMAKVIEHLEPVSQNWKPEIAFASEHCKQLVRTENRFPNVYSARRGRQELEIIFIFRT